MSYSNQPSNFVHIKKFLAVCANSAVRYEIWILVLISCELTFTVVGSDHEYNPG